jgi:hypothetical protein
MLKYYNQPDDSISIDIRSSTSWEASYLLFLPIQYKNINFLLINLNTFKNFEIEASRYQNKQQEQSSIQNFFQKRVLIDILFQVIISNILLFLGLREPYLSHS